MVTVVRNFNCPRLITIAVYALLKQENSNAPTEMSKDLADQGEEDGSEFPRFSGEKESKQIRWKNVKAEGGVNEEFLQMGF